MCISDFTKLLLRNCQPSLQPSFLGCRHSNFKQKIHEHKKVKTVDKGKFGHVTRASFLSQNERSQINNQHILIRGK